MTTIQDLTADEANKVNLEILENSVAVLKFGMGIKRAGNIATINSMSVVDIQYHNFVVQLCVADSAKRSWEPKKDYDKNYFCSFIYHGSTTEHLLDGTLLHTFNPGGGESFINMPLVEDVPTYELFDRMAWLCFSSYVPYTATCMHVNDRAVIPANLGVVVALGSLKYEQTIRALEYLAPQESEIEVSGNARIVLIKHGAYVNAPLGNAKI